MTTNEQRDAAIKQFRDGNANSGDLYDAGYAAALEAGKWVPVSERLPLIGETVLITCLSDEDGRRYVQAARYNEGFHIYNDADYQWGDKVLAWTAIDKFPPYQQGGNQ